MVPAEPRKFSILHVDDFDEFLDEFRDIFAADFDIVSVQCASEARALLGQRDFDAIVLDYDMPDMDGLTFLRTVRERWAFPPIIFCTGQGSEDVARSAFTAGATDYFVKDFSFFVDRHKLVNAVRQAVEKRATAEALLKERKMLNDVIDLNPYSIEIFDRDGHMIRYNQAALDLWKGVPEASYSAWTDPALLAAGYGPLFERL